MRRLCVRGVISTRRRLRRTVTTSKARKSRHIGGQRAGGEKKLGRGGRACLCWSIRCSDSGGCNTAQWQKLQIEEGAGLDWQPRITAPVQTICSTRHYIRESKNCRSLFFFFFLSFSFYMIEGVRYRPKSGLSGASCSRDDEGSATAAGTKTKLPKKAEQSLRATKTQSTDRSF